MIDYGGNGKKGEAALGDEQRVLIECVEDILRTTPGLNYQLMLGPEQINGSERSTYALFLIETNPFCDLTTSIELAEQMFVVRINGRAFTQKRGRASRFEWWVERRCRDLMAMVNGELRVEQESFMNFPVTSTLSAGAGRKWRKLGIHENGWTGVLSFFLPYGMFLTRSRTTVYSDWFHVV